MSDLNHYTAPKAAISAKERQLEEGGAWRDGDLLAMTSGFGLPDRCLKCNQPTDQRRLKRNLSWHQPFWFVLLVISPLIYIIVAMIVRKTGKVAVPLCPAHRRSRRWAIAVGWLSALVGVGFIIIGAGMFDRPDVGLIGGLVFLFFGILYGVLRSQVAVPQKIDKRLIWLRKVHPDFLAELPPLASA